jgi:hypothetical protein
MSISWLENIHAAITMPVEVREDVDGWHSCVISDVRASQWNNDNATSQPIGSLAIIKDLTVIDIHLTTNGGDWRGSAILTRIGDHIDIEESTAGTFFTHGKGLSGAMMLNERINNNKRSIEDRGPVIQLTKPLLVHYGIPVTNMSIEKVRSVCNNNFIYTQEVHNQKQVEIPAGTHGL